MKLLAFAASSSKKSINKKLISYATTLIESSNVEILDLNDYELPLFSSDREDELGQPALAKEFFEKIGRCDALIISFAEHNGTYSAAYKNLFDWCSRIDKKVFQNKPMVMLSTSPGPGGAKTVLAQAITSAPHFNADLKGSYSIPQFHKNFDAENGRISNQEINAELTAVIAKLN